MTDSPAGKVDQTQQEAAKNDIPQIPKPRLDEEIGKRRELEAQNADLLAKLKAIESAKKPDDLESTIKKVVAPIERQLTAARFAVAKGVTEEAANLVLDYQAKGLDETEAIAAARSKKPDLFVKQGDQQFRAGMHGALPPQSGVDAPQADEWNYQQEAQKARAAGKSQRDVAMEGLRRQFAQYGFNKK